MLSVVIPTLNAGIAISKTLSSLGRGVGLDLISEIIVSDGGSSDETCKIAQEAGAKIITGAQGRGAQLAAGAEAASGSWLLFLHADTVLEQGWRDEVSSFIENNANSGKAGVFRFKLDDEAAGARTLERIVSFRCALFGLPYGDQGLVVSKELYGQLGGFSEIPLMEDVDFVRRIGRERLHYFVSCALTSAERYKQDGYIKRMTRNATCLTLFFAGVKPERILRLYQ